MDDQNRNLILATALSFLVILGWFLLFPPPPPEQVAPPDGADRRRCGRRAIAAAPGGVGTGALPDLSSGPIASRDEVLARTDRVPMRTRAAARARSR